MGLGEQGPRVHLIDLRSAKSYRDAKTRTHIPYKFAGQQNKNLTGTAQYASIDTQLGVDHTRRDNCESLGFIFMYFLRGSLPWQDIHAATESEKLDEILRIKQTVTVEELCAGYPKEFSVYLNYTRGLGFDEGPDFNYLRKLFRNLYIREGYHYDYVFDWTVVKYQQEGKDKSSDRFGVKKEDSDDRHARDPSDEVKNAGDIKPASDGNASVVLKDVDVDDDDESLSKEIKNQIVGNLFSAALDADNQGEEQFQDMMGSDVRSVLEEVVEGVLYV
ncbi:serine/threonine protein kinase [Rhizophlyctis rosea]|uniref:Serine/threonine protein kinase n=1 Tax=Rhizophlyctis rosea TaxID=64517 RepID=A0AAD5SKE3_9FUNG|nr:serine/threonine protein kinase [Rhizophlyctis rosea]